MNDGSYLFILATPCGMLSKNFAKIHSSIVVKKDLKKGSEIEDVKDS